MEVIFMEAVQLGLDRGESFLFEERLVGMTDLLDRPLPELRGGLNLVFQWRGTGLWSAPSVHLW